MMLSPINVNRFCQKILGHDSDDWQQSYEKITFKVIYNFLHWHLSQRKGDRGRAKPGIRKKSSLITFWCTFRIAFERATRHKIDAIVDRQRMSNVCVPVFDLFIADGSRPWSNLETVSN